MWNDIIKKVMKKIEINDEVYEKLEKAYADFKKSQDKIPPAVYKKYGDSLDSFVQQILSDYIDNLQKSVEFTKSFGDMFKGLDMSKLKEELSSLSSLFSGEMEKKEDKEEEKTSDPSKTKN